MKHYPPTQRPSKTSALLSAAIELIPWFLMLVMVLSLVLWNLSLRTQVLELSLEKAYLTEQLSEQDHSFGVY